MKNTLLILFVFMLPFIVFSTACKKECDQQSPLNIGDIHEGGFVFYLGECGGKVCSTTDLGSMDWESAINACEMYEGDNYTSWYMPSKEELDLIYNELYLNGHGDFSNGQYWSSTQEWFIFLGANTRNFFTSNTFISKLDQSNNVRAVREF